MIHVRMLGAVELTVDGNPAPPELLWRKNIALLVYLLRNNRRAASREQLLALLWADKPEAKARRSLNVALSTLRGMLGEDALETGIDQVRLRPGTVSIDLDQFDEHVSAGRLPDAIGLIGGLFLEGLTVSGASDFQDWLEAERKIWRDRSVQLLVRQASVLLGSGQHQQATDLARIARTLDPLGEMPLQVLLRALTLAGHRVEALQEFDDFAARLEQVLGTDVSADTRALVERVRQQRIRPAEQVPTLPELRRRFPLAGREKELARIIGLWDQVRSARQAGLVLIEGETGVGKTRLLEELAAHASLDGAAIGSARVVERDLDQPDATLWGLARGGLLSAPGVAGAMPATLATFAERIPEWRERFPGASGPTLGVAEALEELLRTIAPEAPVVLLVDDAQWADRGSLLGLEFLLRGVDGVPVLLALAAEPYPPREELDAIRSRGSRQSRSAFISLGPLGAAAIRELVRTALPRFSDWESERVTRRIQVDSAGLPLLVVELLHGVALGMDLQGMEGAWPEPMRTLSQTIPGGLPEAVVGAIRVGFRRLSPAAQQVLVAAAVLGDRVPAGVLSLATQTDPATVNQALDDLEWHRWLAADARGYSFVARIAREVVARDMVTRGQRQRIESLAGEWDRSA